MPAPSPQLYDATDTTLQTVPISTGTIAAGTSYGPITVHLWDDKGGLIGSDTINDAFLIAQYWNGSDWLTSGAPVVDEGWVKARLSGVVNPGNDATLTTQSSGYVPVSAFHPLPLNPIPKNCARIIDVKIEVPAGSTDVTQQVRLALLYNEQVIPLGTFTSLATGGAVIPDRFDASYRRLLASAFAGDPLSAAGTAIVTVASLWYVYDGRPWYQVQQTVTLNQTDGAAAALTVGTAYIATISQAASAGVVTVTKGTKSAAPTKPNVPSGELLLGYVTVVYQGGGTSIINTANIDCSTVVFGEYYVTPATGLNVYIHPGRAITTVDTLTLSSVKSTLAVPYAFSFVWLLPDGTFTCTDTAVVPQVGAIYLAVVTTAGGVVTAIRNDNAEIGRAIDFYPMTLRYKGALAVGTDVDWDVLPHGSVGAIDGSDWDLDRVFVDVGVTGSGAGSTIFDINYRLVNGSLSVPGTTIYTSQATVDRRPQSNGARQTYLDPEQTSGGLSVNQVVGDASHEVRTFASGMRFSFDIDAVQATPPRDVSIQLLFRRLR
jgi:hypothetical protein